MILRSRHSAIACTILTLGLAAIATWATDTAPSPATQSATAPQIEVCFVLDTTGSMGALIEGAKAKIWSIANQMIAAKTTPKLKVALLAYRDRGDEYITKVFDLTEDLDAVYAHLREFQAAGGGDEPESVNQALHEAVTKIAWSRDREVLKIIFLVGDSPPHMDYKDDQKYAQTCELAARQDLLINTVQCGENTRTTPIWQDIAKRAEGRFVSISQSGDVQIVHTPMDDQLAELNVTMGATLVPYGRVEQQRAVMAKQVRAEAASAPAAADRLAYNAARGKGVQGTGDLLDDIKDGTVTLDKIKNEDLPAEMQKMSLPEQEEFLKHKTEQRQEAQAKIGELVKQRQAYIENELQKRRAAGKGPAFDTEVAQLIREQGQRKGIQYAEPSTTQPSDPSTQR